MLGATAEHASWDAVLAALWRLKPFEESFARAEAAADAEVPVVDEDQPPPAKKRSKKSRDAADVQAEARLMAERREERERIRQHALCRHVYFELRARVAATKARTAPPAKAHTSKPKEVQGTGHRAQGTWYSKPKEGPAEELDDLYQLWLEPKKLKVHVGFYLELVGRGRLGGHEPSDYLRDEADTWRRYEARQRREGCLDFDAMLTLFYELLVTHEDARRRFLSMYAHLVVDEFQDNSGLQTRLLKLMVADDAPSLTVVGDEDQCIYQ